MSGFVVWFTGLSGSGKSTLATLLGAELARRGVHVETLDGDEVRTFLSAGLGFSREDRDTNVRRIGFVAKLLARSGACAITAAISPYRAVRDEQRRAVGRFCEVYCACPIDELARRDAKGLYRRALAGEITGFTGVDDPYEEPEHPDVVVHTDRESKHESLARILARLEALGFLAPTDAAGDARTPWHGGEAPGHYVADAARRAALEGAPSVELSTSLASTLDAIVTGTYAPLQGFLGSRDLVAVLRERRLERGLPWPLPAVLPLPADVAAGLAAGATLALRAQGRPVALLDVAEVYGLDVVPPDLRGAIAPFAPAAEGASFAAGRVWTLDERSPRRDSVFDTPLALRAALITHGAANAAGLFVDGAFDRGHEHAARALLETSDALVLLVPEHHATLPLAARLAAVEAAVAQTLAPERVLVVVYAGAAAPCGEPARDALLRAIVAQNHGVARVALELDDAASEASLAGAAGTLAVEIEPLAPAFHSQRSHTVATARSAAFDPAHDRPIDRADALARLSARSLPDPRDVRDEVARALLDAWGAT